jgi:drug/metabolite transporter (DMT)-like permease
MPSSASPPHDHVSLKGILLVCLSVAMWASGGVFTRLLPYDLWTIVFWRGVFGTVFIGAYVTYSCGSETPSLVWRTGWNGLLVTLCLVVAITIFPAAFQRTSVANAFTILAALPFVTAALAWVWLGERPPLATLIASAIAFLGIVIMVGPAGGPQAGDVLAMIGTLAQALTIVIVRRNAHIVMLPMAWMAVILSTIVAYPLAGHLWELTPRDYLVAAGFGLGPMLLGMMLYVIGSAMIPATLSALIGTGEAPLGALWTWLGVGEVPPLATIIGGAVVLASVIGRLSRAPCSCSGGPGHPIDYEEAGITPASLRTDIQTRLSLSASARDR